MIPEHLIQRARRQMDIADQLKRQHGSTAIAGTLPCPECGKTLHFRNDDTSNVLTFFQCETPGCLELLDARSGTVSTIVRESNQPNPPKWDGPMA